MFKRSKWEANLLFFDTCVIINSALCQLAYQISPSLDQDSLYNERSCSATQDVQFTPTLL
jgi:hypothetical protein